LTGGEEGVLAASLSNKGYDEARKNIEKLTALFGKRMSMSNCSVTAILSKSAATKRQCVLPKH